MKIKPLLIFSVSLLVFCFIVSGCSKGEKTPKQEEQKKQVSTKTAKAPKPPKEESKNEPVPVAYHYDPAGKTDPFRPLIVEEAKGSAKGMAKKAGSVPPLQRYDLDQLKLVGVITNAKPPRALIEDVAGDGYIVTPGTFVGRNEGIITEIRESEIIIEEKQLDVFGKLAKRKSILKLRQPEELEEK